MSVPCRIDRCLLLCLALSLVATSAWGFDREAAIQQGKAALIEVHGRDASKQAWLTIV